ncbi:MAG: TIGR03118 family protein [Sporichthyaceae bacterium]
MTVLRALPTAAVAAMLCLPLSGCGGDDEKPAASASGAAREGGYEQVNLVANDASYRPQIVEPDMRNAWGISLRPAGAGGHFWITASATGKSIEYVGDVGEKNLFQDGLTVVSVPGVEKPEQGTPTGTVFNEKGPGFVITQQAGTEKITAPAKFFFATDEGLLTAWTERKNADGTFAWPSGSEVVFDRSKAGGKFFGVAISPANDRLYLADFGEKPSVVVLDEKFAPLPEAGFANPFEKEYAPFNVQTIGNSVFVAYAKWAEAGEEEPAPGDGRLAEFSPDGELIATWDGGRYLNAPWGIAQAPSTGFGKHNGALLVSNFGDGTIVALDPATRKVTDFLRRPDGHRVEIDGLWDVKFGNGQSLGQANALYFAAGPGPEADGIFGRLTWVD